MYFTEAEGRLLDQSHRDVLYFSIRLAIFLILSDKLISPGPEGHKTIYSNYYTLQVPSSFLI